MKFHTFAKPSTLYETTISLMVLFRVYLLLLCNSFMSQAILAQQPKYIIEKQWDILKSQLQKRNSYISEIALEFKKDNQLDSLNNNLLWHVKELNIIFNKRKIFDSTLIKLASQQTDSIELILPTWVMAIKSKSLERKRNISSLLLKIENIDNRLLMDKQYYNDLCEDQPSFWFQLKKWNLDLFRQPM